MAAGAHRRQKLIVWGTGTSKTVEVEVDATVICRWRVEEQGVLVYYYYCYIGARQRGNMKNLALKPFRVHSLQTGLASASSRDGCSGCCLGLLKIGVLF